MYYIKILGFKEPIYVTREVAEKVSEAKANANPDDLLDIHHKNGIIKNIQVKKIDFVHFPPEPRISDIADLEIPNEDKLREELEEKIKKQKLSLREEYRLLKKYKILKVEELVDNPKTASDFYVSVINPKGYERAQNMIKEIRNKYAKINYAKQRELEDLDKIAKTMGYE